MGIEGVQILEAKIIYSPWFLGISVCVLFFLLTIIFFVIATDDLRYIIIGIFFAVIFLYTLWASYVNNTSTFLNYPNKIRYTIEVIDDNAWKQIGPNYTVLEKVYSNKEIYIIQGDYCDDGL